MDAIFPLAALFGCLWLTMRSLGHGLGLLLAFGYFNGLIRANFLGVATTFMFDMAVTGVYAGVLLTQWPRLRAVLQTRLGLFTVLLMGWPLLLSFVPVNHLLVQFVALRATVWFLPMLLVGVLLGPVDLDRLARWAAVLNCLSFVVGLYTFQFGIESLYPHNAVTDIMYRSSDVTGGYHRVPATFMSAHLYGGTMLFSLPLVLELLVRRTGSLTDRWLGAAGAAAAVAGVLMCAARSPVVIGVLAAGVYWVLAGMSARAGVGLALLAAVGTYLVATNDRLQRVTELADVEAVAERAYGSNNEGFVELFTEYPFGAGMGSSVGTNIPFFLAAEAPKQIGLENEYSRILVDQGWVGLIGWLAFVGWLFAAPPLFAGRRLWADGRKLMYAFCLVAWATAYIGNGLLAAIPAAVMLLLFMGVVARPRVTTGGAA